MRFIVLNIEDERDHLPQRHMLEAVEHELRPPFCQTGLHSFIIIGISLFSIRFSEHPKKRNVFSKERHIVSKKFLLECSHRNREVYAIK